MRYELAYRDTGSDYIKHKIFDLSDDQSAIEASFNFLTNTQEAVSLSYVCVQPMLNGVGLAALKQRQTKAA